MKIYGNTSRALRTLAALVLLAGTLLPFAASAQLLPNTTNADIDSIVALVDEDIILRSELDHAITGITKQIQARGEAMPPMHLLESQVLERLIITELQVQRALQTGIRVSDADIDQYLVNIAQNNNITVQQMRQTIEADGIDFTEFRRDIGEQMMTERLQQRIVNSMDPRSISCWPRRTKAAANTTSRTSWCSSRTARPRNRLPRQRQRRTTFTRGWSTGSSSPRRPFPTPRGRKPCRVA